MDKIWLASPSPAIRMWPGAPDSGWRVNEAARGWAEVRALGADLWATVADELHAALRDARRGRLAALPLQWTAVELDDGWLVWFSPASDAETPAPWRSADDKLALIQELGNVGVFERDLRTQSARWDANMFRLFGLDPADGQPRFDVALQAVHPDDRERMVEANLRAAREGGRHRQRYRIVLPDGRVRDISNLVDVRLDATGAPMTITGVAIDDSENATHLRAQRVLNNDLVRALELAQIAVWRVDRATQRVHMNSVGYALAGKPPSRDGLGIQVMREMTHPDDLREMDAVSSVSAGTDVLDLEIRFRTPDGSAYMPMLTRRVVERDAQGQVTGMLGVTIDRQDRARERERVRALARHFRLVTDAAELGIWSADAEDSHVEWNAQMCKIYGVGRDAVPTSLQAWRDRFVHPDDRDELTHTRTRAVALGAHSFGTEFRIIRPDGGVRWVTSRSRREEHRGRTVLVGIHLDTTELVLHRQRAEQALRSSQAKSEFLSRASHELRTPLNAVLGFAQLIEHDGVDVPMELQLDRVAHIRTAGEHLLALVDDVLDLASIEAGDLSVTLAPIAVDAVLSDTAQWFASLAQRRGVTIEVERSGGWVRADARRLRQILSNLLGNAIKFSRPGGRVWLGAGRRGDADARRWCITVCDDGPGYTPEQQAALFEVFHRIGGEADGGRAESGSAGVGLGLGLAIAQQLVLLMGGSIEVASVVDQGSEFRIELPAASEQTAASKPVVPPHRPALSVLYIEDNPVNAILVEGLVALRPGVELRCAVDGLSGVAMAIARPPQLLLIDMQLPDIDGIEVLRRLRLEAALDGTRMVALSANGMTEDIARARAAGFDDYWTKPIDFKQFLAQLDELCAAVRA